MAADALLRCVVVGAVLATLTHGDTVPTPRHKLVVMVMSGMRHDYLNQPNLGTISAFKQAGFYANKLTVPMISNSWPSLWSLATGFYPEEHGILDNDMFDPDIGTRFSRSQNNTRWYEKEPLWTTAENQGVKTAVAGYPGGTVPYRRVTPSHSWLFREKRNFAELNDIIRLVVELLTHDVDLAFLMLPEPDNTAHRFGVSANETREEIKRNDLHLQYLISQLNEQQLTESTNIIIVGDHGMTDHESGNTIYLNDCIALADLDFFTGNIFTTGMIEPKDDVDLEQMYSDLVTCHPNLSVYKKDDIPNEFHLKGHRRMTPFLVIPDEGWRVQMLRPQGDFPIEEDKIYGMHGYLNTLESMKTVLLAKGPDFNVGSTESFNSIDLYPLMCNLLGVICSSTPGRLEVSQPWINHPLVDERPSYQPPTYQPSQEVKSGRASGASAQALILPVFVYILVIFSLLAA